MGSLIFLCSVVLATLTSNPVHGAVNHVPLPTINLTEWWGPGNGSTDEDTSIVNYTICFNDTMISDLISRFDNRRSFKKPLEGAAFTYGFNSTTLQTWIDYITNEYSFSDRETYLNQYSHYKTRIQGLDIHFMRVTSNSSYTVVPLLLLHGWPDSIVEFYETIPYLISIGEENSIAFDIIVPSLPGFAFSDGAVRPGMGVDKVAVIFYNLMNRIGYDQYYVHGQELGGMIGSNMATLFPENVLGYHTTYPFFHTLDIMFRLFLSANNTDDVVDATYKDRIYPLTDAIFNLTTATGYLHHIATKPDTVGIVTSESPSGLLAYMFEKFSVGVRKKFLYYPDGGLTEILNADQMVDNFMLYWSTNCMVTAARLYGETFNKRYFGLRINEIRTPVPAWTLQSPDEYLYLPDWMIKMKFINYLNGTLPDEGGHFYAWEKPDLFAQDVVDAVIAFTDWHTINDTEYTNCKNNSRYPTSKSFGWQKNFRHLATNYSADPHESSMVQYAPSRPYYKGSLALCRGPLTD